MQRGDKGVSEHYLKAQHQHGFCPALTVCPGLCYSDRVM